MIYRFPIYVPGIAAAFALLCGAIGVFLLWKRLPRLLSLPAFVISALVAGILVPTLALDRVILNDEKVEQTTGFWFAPTVKGFYFAKVASITIGTASDSHALGQEVWTINMKDGQSFQVDPGDLWVLNGKDIAERLKAKGVEVKR